MLINGKERTVKLTLNHLGTIAKELGVDFLGTPGEAMEKCGPEEVVNIIWMVLGPELEDEHYTVDQFVEDITPELAGDMYIAVLRNVVDWLVQIAPALAVSVILHVAVEGYVIGQQVQEAIECAHSRAEEILKSLDLADEETKASFNDMIKTMESNYGG